MLVMEQKARNPVPHGRRSQSNEVERNVFCKHYDACLDEAIEKKWQGFSCIECEGYLYRSEIMSELSMISFPIEKPTFKTYDNRSVGGKEEEMANTEEPPKKSDSTCVCHCGKEFEPYKRGVVIVKTVCQECLREKNKANADNARKASSPKKPSKEDGVTATPTSHKSVTLAFDGKDLPMFERIKTASARERRTMESQILYWLETFVPDLCANE